MPAILWAILIAYFLFSPSQGIPRITFFQQIPHFDKFVHVLLFGMLTLLLIFGFEKQQRFKSHRSKAAVTALLVAIIYGGFTEYLQHLLPTGRTSDSIDFIADLAGIIGCFFISLLWKVNRYKSQEK